MKRWKVSNKAVYNVAFHLIWCPKYRRKVLVDDVEKRLRELLHEKAEELDVEIESLEIMPDHLHMFVKADPTSPAHYLVNQFKGYSSRVLRKEFSSLKSRMPSLWTRSYYCETVGHIGDGTSPNEDTIKQYIADQKEN